MKLTRYLLVSNKQDFETVKVIDSLYLETTQYTVCCLDKKHFTSKDAGAVLQIKEGVPPIEYLNSLQLSNPDKIKPDLLVSRDESLVFLGLIYETQEVKFSKVGKQPPKVKLISKTLFMRCITEKCTEVYFPILTISPGAKKNHIYSNFLSYFQSNFEVTSYE